MTYLSNLSLRLKLLAGFAVIIALLIASAATAQLFSGQTYSATQSLAVKTVPVVELAEQVQYDIANSFGLQATYILGDHTAQRGYFVQSMDQTRSDIARMGRFATDGTYRRALGEVHAGLTQFLALDRTAWADVRNGQPKPMAQAANITLNVAVPAYDSLLGGATAFLKHAKALAGRAVDRARSAHSTSLVLSIAITLLAVIFAVAIAVVVSASIKRRVDLVLDRLALLQSGPVAGVRDGLRAFAKGDLTQTFDVSIEPIANPGADEIGQVGAEVNRIRDAVLGALDSYEESRSRLSALVGQVARSAVDVSSASTQMAATSEEAGRASGEIVQAIGEIANGAQRQVEAVEQAQRSAHEVARAVEEAVVSASATAEVAHHARAAAQGGVLSAQQANDAMQSVRESSQAVGTAIRGLAEKSDQIGAIVATITGIAEQTNLLALNAAIEAARAGEQGRGFAVVAEEVRKLAEDSQRATHEIAELVGAIQRETNHAVDVVQDGAQRTVDGAAIVARTRETFERIDQSVQSVGDHIEQIAGISERIAVSAREMEQSIADVASVAEESSATTEQVSASTETNSASAQEIAASAQELSANSELLHDLVAQFSLTH